MFHVIFCFVYELQAPFLCKYLKTSAESTYEGSIHSNIKLLPFLFIYHAVPITVSLSPFCRCLCAQRPPNPIQSVFQQSSTYMLMSSSYYTGTDIGCGTNGVPHSSLFLLILKPLQICPHQAERSASISFYSKHVVLIIMTPLHPAGRCCSYTIWCTHLPALLGIQE